MIRVFSVAIPSRILALFVSESVIVYGCYLIAAWLDPDVGDFQSFLSVDAGALRIFFVAAAIVLGLYFRDLYAQIRIRNRLALLQELCMIFGVAFVVQGAINYLNHDLTIPRKVMISGSLLALASIFLWRLVIATAAGDGAGTGRVMFLGTSPTIGVVARYLLLHPELGLAPVGYLDESSALSLPVSMPRLGAIEDLDEAIESYHPDSIVIGRRETIKPWWTSEFLELHFGGIHTEEAATLYEKAFGRVCVTEVWPDDLVFADTFQPTRLSLNIQTFYSVVIAAVVGAALLPVIAAIGFWLKVSSRGPILSRDRRLGLNGIPFTMYSFAGSQRTAPEGEPGTSGSAPFLQKTGLDALPRLLNVLRGQMALVGPAPERPEFAARLAEAVPLYRQRQLVKPGIIGWEQIHRDRRSPTDSLLRFEYDLYYMKHLSASFDSVVLLLWAKRMLVGELAAI